jgi:hypothetical protein
MIKGLIFHDNTILTIKDDITYNNKWIKIVQTSQVDHCLNLILTFSVYIDDQIKKTV